MTLREVLDAAKVHLKELTTVQEPDFRLEQAEYDKSASEWELVVSFLVDNTNKRTLPMGLLTSEFQYHRIYKRIKIDDNKEFKGLFIYSHREE